MNNQNLNSPAIVTGQITAADLEAHRLASSDSFEPWHLPHMQWTLNDDLCHSHRPPPAEASTEIGAETQGRHRAGWITRAWLRFARALG